MKPWLAYLCAAGCGALAFVSVDPAQNAWAVAAVWAFAYAHERARRT